MPVYEFLNSKTGRVEEHSRLIAERDNVPKHLKRIVIPKTVGYANHSGLRETGADADVPKAFREYELSGKSVKTIERETGFSRDHIRRVWNFLILALFSVTLSARAVDLQAGYTFVPTDHVTSTKLNNLMGLGTINTDFVHLKTAVLPLAADELLLWQSSGAIYRKVRFDTAFLSNTNLVIGQTDDTQPTSADYVLTWDASANSLKRANLDSLIFTNAALINGRSNWLGPANIANGMTLLGSMGGNLYYQIGVSNLLTFTNLANHTIMHGNDQLQVFSFAFGTNRTISLTGLISNAQNASVMQPNSFVLGISNNAAGPQKISATNIARFVVQKFSVGSISVPNSSVSYTNAHSLGGLPQLISARIVCTNAELGYAVGDEVNVESVVDASGNPMGTISADAANVYFNCVNATWNIAQHAAGPTRVNIAKTNWNFRFQAFLFP